MIELIVNKQDDEKTICLVESGKLIEIYKENDENIEHRNEGNIYAGLVKDIIPGMQSAFVDIGTDKNSFIHAKDIMPRIDQVKEKEQEVPDIRTLVKKNDLVLVQVKKDSNNKKGARTSTHINLTGKYVVMMPNTDIVTISQKIEDEKEKLRLKEIVKKYLPENIGAIVRTAAGGGSEELLKTDIEEQLKIWDDILQKFNTLEQYPVILHKAPNIVEKILIDMCSNNVQKIIVNNREDYNDIKTILSTYKNISIEIKEENLLNMYDLQEQIDKREERKVWLKCGGFISIDKTEALTAIDVNSRKFTGKSDFEETIYKVNYEATIEIAKQLRLRDIGGIIIIDYIDMKEQKHKDEIQELLRQCLKKDRAKTQIEGFTRLNLMEMTRKHICSHND